MATAWSVVYRVAWRGVGCTARRWSVGLSSARTAAWRGIVRAAKGRLLSFGSCFVIICKKILDRER